MGKAIAVGITIIVIVIIGAFLAAWFRRQDTKEKAAEKGWALKGDLNKAQERLLVTCLDQAALLLRGLAAPPEQSSLDWAQHSTLLSPEDRARVETWLRGYNTTLKGISR